MAEVGGPEESIVIQGKSYRFKDDSLWVRFRIPIFGVIRFNPVVSSVAVCLIWCFVGICCTEKEKLPFHQWQQWIVDKFTWLYIGSQDAWALFGIVLYFSKYSKIKLGKDDDVPEYNDFTWFVMLFACGMGTGLFFFGVYEPIYHYTRASRYSANPTVPDNALEQIAINLTLYHWGIHAWIVYSLVGMLLGLLTFRENLPMTMKSCLYPLIGDRIFGWVGDAADVVSILTTLVGVCTSLNLGTKQLNTGLNMINSDIPADNVSVQLVIIWCITTIATISAVSGIGMGIRRLSQTCFAVGLFIMIIVVLADDTFYILDILVQSVGFYFQNVIQLGCHTDAFEQLGKSHGWQDRGRWLPPRVDFADGPRGWMHEWTMFYWGWWISWSPFVGMFIAKISKGRTIKEFINGTLTAPVLFSFVWLCVMGGAGLRQERSAARRGLCCSSGKALITPQVMNQTIHLMNVVDLTINLDDTNFLCESGKCNECTTRFLTKKAESGATYGDFVDEYLELGKSFGKVEGDKTLVRLSCFPMEEMWFHLIYSYGCLGQFLAISSLLGIVLYFVTSSDSGSLVTDCLSANGDPDPPRIQRIFWALMEGAMATALVVAGDEKSIDTLQMAGVCSGLPYTFVVCLVCLSLWRVVKVTAGDLDPEGPSFAIGVLDPFATLPYKRVLSSDSIMWRYFVGFVKNVLVAPWTVSRVYGRLNGLDGLTLVHVAAFSTFAFTIVCHLLQLLFRGAWAIAWFWYLSFVTIIAVVRGQVRQRFRIHGSFMEDFFLSVLLYPSVVLQMDLTMASQQEPTQSESKCKDEKTWNELVDF